MIGHLFICLLTSALTEAQLPAAPQRAGGLIQKKITGVFTPPETGEYKFYSSCSLPCGIYLSDSELMSEQNMIVKEQQIAPPGVFDQFADQASHLIYLEAGVPVYLKASSLYSADEDSPSLSVGVMLPDDGKLFPISQRFLRNVVIENVPVVEQVVVKPPTPPTSSHLVLPKSQPSTLASSESVPKHKKKAKKSKHKTKMSKNLEKLGLILGSLQKTDGDDDDSDENDDFDISKVLGKLKKGFFGHKKSHKHKSSHHSTKHKQLSEDILKKFSGESENGRQIEKNSKETEKQMTSKLNANPIKTDNKNFEEPSQDTDEVSAQLNKLQTLILSKGGSDPLQHLKEVESLEERLSELKNSIKKKAYHLNTFSTDVPKDKSKSRNEKEQSQEVKYQIKDGDQSQNPSPPADTHTAAFSTTNQTAPKVSSVLFRNNALSTSSLPIKETKEPSVKDSPVKETEGSPITADLPVKETDGVTTSSSFAVKETNEPSLRVKPTIQPLVTMNETDIVEIETEVNSDDIIGNIMSKSHKQKHNEKEKSASVQSNEKPSENNSAITENVISDMEAKLKQDIKNMEEANKIKGAEESDKSEKSAEKSEGKIKSTKDQKENNQKEAKFQEPPEKESNAQEDYNAKEDTNAKDYSTEEDIIQTIDDVKGKDESQLNEKDKSKPLEQDALKGPIINPGKPQSKLAENDKKLKDSIKEFLLNAHSQGKYSAQAFTESMLKMITEKELAAQVEAIENEKPNHPSDAHSKTRIASKDKNAEHTIEDMVNKQLKAKNFAFENIIPSNLHAEGEKKNIKDKTEESFLKKLAADKPVQSSSRLKQDMGKFNSDDIQNLLTPEFLKEIISSTDPTLPQPSKLATQKASARDQTIDATVYYKHSDPNVKPTVKLVAHTNKPPQEAFESSAAKSSRLIEEINQLLAGKQSHVAQNPPQGSTDLETTLSALNVKQTPNSMDHIVKPVITTTKVSGGSINVKDTPFNKLNGLSVDFNYDKFLHGLGIPDVKFKYDQPSAPMESTSRPVENTVVTTNGFLQDNVRPNAEIKNKHVETIPIVVANPGLPTTKYLQPQLKSESLVEKNTDHELEEKLKLSIEKALDDSTHAFYHSTPKQVDVPDLAIKITGAPAANFDSTILPETVKQLANVMLNKVENPWQAEIRAPTTGVIHPSLQRSSHPAVQVGFTQKNGNIAVKPPPAPLDDGDTIAVTEIRALLDEIDSIKKKISNMKRGKIIGGKESKKDLVARLKSKEKLLSKLRSRKRSSIHHETMHTPK